MGLSRFIASQLGRPSGLFGRFFMADFLDRGNARQIEQAIELLDPQPESFVLDVGFGGGHGFTMLLARIERGKVHGVELSTAMVSRVKRRFAKAIAAGRLSVVAGNVEALPYPDAMFDCVMTVNTLYFWDDPDGALREIRRVLKPGGRVLVSAATRAALENFAVARNGFFHLYTAEEMTALVESAGFHDVRCEQPEEWRETVYVIGQA